MGATQQQVVALLGVPDGVQACGDGLWWGDDTKYRGENVGRCVTEARYENFLSIWAVGYSQDGCVVLNTIILLSESQYGSSLYPPLGHCTL
jgi:hypothetical protein